MIESTTIRDRHDTAFMARSIESHEAAGFGEEAASYRRVLFPCSGGSPLAPSKFYTPFRKLGPILWVAIGIAIGGSVGMVCGAASKYCPPAHTSTP